jgi:quinol monooxygenase YgiN
MIIVSGRIYVRPGTREKFLALSTEAIIQARRASGCRDFVVAADPFDGNRVNVYEEWDSRKALTAFRGAGPGPDLSSLIEKAQVVERSVSAGKRA